MGTEKRARQKANRQQKLEELERQEKKDQVRQYSVMAAVVAVALLGGLALLVFAFGDDDEAATETVAAEAEDSSATDSAETDSDTDSEAAADPALTADPVDPVCPEEDGSSPRTLNFTGPPPSCLDPSKSYVANFDTNLGPITIELDAEKAPNTVNNFVFLARHKYYDNTVFHRIIEDFMIQGGDPTGDPPGTGGPGYTIDEETPAPGEYQIGSIAMAKRPTPSTTGAQFFIVTGPNGEALPPEYSLFGQVTEGLDVVQAIEALPTDGSDYPTEEIIINSISISET